MNNGKDTDKTMAGGNFPYNTGESLAGKQIGGYRIIKELGRGGMAMVYEAYETALDRKVALKIIPPLLAEDKEYIRRFKREAVSAAKLKHPNIVSIHGTGISACIYYYVMDLVEGKTLDSIIEEKRHELLKSARRFTVTEALSITEQAADALCYSHKHGIIHRDIKPGNIIIDKDSNRPLITDFGLAQELKPGKVMADVFISGTPVYMSPEQAQGKQLDRRTDIYSLGAVLYEMLTGVVPYQGNNAIEVIEKVKTEPLIPPGRINPKIPQGVETIILKAMSRDIRLRYQSMDEFLADIYRWRRGAKITGFTDIKERRAQKRKIFLRRILHTFLYISLSAGVFWGSILLWKRVKWKKEMRYVNSKFQLAENYINLGMDREAEKVYKEILNEYPGTGFAARAEKMLKRQQNQTKQNQQNQGTQY